MKLADINAGQYRERVERACEFFVGQSKELLQTLENEMRKAATALDFERAAEMRNMLDDLRKTTKPMARFTRDQRHRLGVTSTIDPIADLAALGEELGLGAPPRRMECFDISNISTTHIVASMVCFVDGRPANHLYRRFRIRTVAGQDDFASMAEVVRRRYARVLGEIADCQLPIANSEPGARIDYAPEHSQEGVTEAAARLTRLNRQSAIGNRQSSLPDLIIIDGGKGQLSSACRELQRLGLHELPIIGLAKEFEEIHRPSRPLPLILPHESGALKMLQRIRDEAHRFANTYHQLLMKRRIAESLLDRLRRASVEDIAATEGISRKLAEQITNFLAERA